MKQAGNKSLANVIDEEKEFTFPCILYSLRDSTTQPGDHAISSDSLDPFALALAAEVAPNLLPFKTESNDGVALHSLERVMRQLGYNQGEVAISRDTGNSMVLLTEVRFIVGGKNLILVGHKMLNMRAKRAMSC